MKKSIAFSLVVVGVALGAVVGRFTAGGSDVPPVAAEDDSYRPQKQAPVDPTNALKAQIAALKRRIAELEGARAIRNDGDASNAVVAVVMTNETPVARDMPRHRSFREDLAELAKTDPARYADVTNHMARGAARRFRRMQTRIQALAQVDTSSFSDDEKKTHDDLIDLLAQREELMQKFRPGADDAEATEDERRATMDEMHALDRKIRQLEKSERATLLVATVESLGVTGDGAAEVVDAVQAIYEATGQGDRGGPDGMPPGPPSDALRR